MLNEEEAVFYTWDKLYIKLLVEEILVVEGKTMNKGWEELGAGI